MTDKDCKETDGCCGEGSKAADVIILHENAMYKVMVGITTHYVHKNPEMFVYKVINKETGVTELESTIYSMAISSADDLLREVREYGVSGDSSTEVVAVENLEGLPDADGNVTPSTH